MSFTCIAAAAFGTAGVVARELRMLGFADAHGQGDDVVFTADEAGVARACLNVRCSDRIQILVHSFTAVTWDELYEGIRAIRWRSLLPRDARVTMSARCVRSTLMSQTDCQAIGKKAIVDAMGGGRMPETGALYPVEISVRQNTVQVLLDACGSSLSKRGYRPVVGEAPIRETLAASILALSGWKGDQVLTDPMCGSGTFAIEAALMAQNIAPGMNRTFTAEAWPLVGKAAFAAARAEAREAVTKAVPVIYASDIDEKALSIARDGARRAGVAGIRFARCDMREALHTDAQVMVTNPPYGKRLTAGDEKALTLLYHDLGQLWGKLPDCSVHVITAYEEFERYFGRRAQATRKLFNSTLACRLYQYPADCPRPRVLDMPAPQKKQEQPRRRAAR